MTACATACSINSGVTKNPLQDLRVYTEVSRQKRICSRLLCAAGELFAVAIGSYS
jgi:hypothetical protein